LLSLLPFFYLPVKAAGFEPLIIGICVKHSTTVLSSLSNKEHFTASYYHTVSYIPNSHLMVEIRVHLQSGAQPRAGFSLLACSQKCCRLTQSYKPLLWYILLFFYLPVKAERFEPLNIGIWVECSTTVLPLLPCKTHFGVGY